ncbi:DeoR family transcriptional regulator [Falsibacillus pallidus]|uniref:DeoR-like protein with HTH domain n=1 Tax=Falsibacillus pallidus TaxID=493781 RepID=A0A370GQ08_9BACI|nr:DeoR family transcriptional regulator [Falsibacillus pallidus]RDI45802.1 DeoR-like protein with HTH domain [Falsibacillus pallidus]
MLPIERKKQIVDWLTKEGSLKIAEISSRLEVSEMTVYRDLRPLLESGEVVKTSGGIMLAPTPEGQLQHHSCSYCHKISLTKQSIQLFTSGHAVEHTCCAHCALLRYSDRPDSFVQIICKDFLRDTTLNAKSAYYVFNPELDLNCCQPTVLTFGTLRDAQRFLNGFGGEIYSFEEALETIHQSMNSHSSCDSKKK